MKKKLGKKLSNNLFDKFLLNKSVYSKLTYKKNSMYMGILLVGLINLSLYMLGNFTHVFYGKSFQVLFYNITLSLLYAVLFGLTYTLFFIFPLFDFFKFFKREKIFERSGFLIHFIKVYIIASILTLPGNILLFIITGKIGYEAYLSIHNISFYIMLIITLWFSAAVTRGLDSACVFFPTFKRIIFIAVLTWNYFLGYVLGYLVVNWALTLYK